MKKWLQQEPKTHSLIRSWKQELTHPSPGSVAGSKGATEVGRIIVRQVRGRLQFLEKWLQQEPNTHSLIDR
jgi:hypothetical protein